MDKKNKEEVWLNDLNAILNDYDLKCQLKRQEQHIKLLIMSRYINYRVYHDEVIYNDTMGLLDVATVIIDRYNNNGIYL